MRRKSPTSIAIDEFRVKPLRYKRNRAYKKGNFYEFMVYRLLEEYWKKLRESAK